MVNPEKEPGQLTQLSQIEITSHTVTFGVPNKDM